ncbi:MAG: alpha/beta hydrolase family esterase [Microthrixaceae bacterium]
MYKRTVGAVAVTALVSVILAGCVPPTPTDPPPPVTGASPGCGTTNRGAVFERPETVTVDGRVRDYVMTVPPVHQPGTTDPVPLVLDFHGLLEGTVRTHPFATQFSALARAEGFAVAFPIGSENGLFWDIAPTESNPDLRFIDTLVDSLGDTMCIDRSRVYVTGLSFGAAMTSMLMCMRPNTFAAAAPVAGMLDLCGATERKVPFVTFHGTADWILPFPLFQNTPAGVAAKYGCEGGPSVETLTPNPDPGTGAPITRTTWDCSGVDSAAEFYTIGNGGHSWPGSDFFTFIGFIVGPNATSLDGTRTIWEFFERFSL